MRGLKVFLVAVIAAMALVSAGCDEAAEEALEEATGLDFVFDEEDTGVDTPDGWVFLFGVELDETQSELIDQDFSVPLDLLAELVDLDGIDEMIAFTKVEALEGYGNRLRYANKLIIESGDLKLDSETIDKLGGSIGSSGAGLYVAYFAEAQNGYISGVVTDCTGSTKEGIVAVASDGPFFTKTVDDGSWALPSLSGKSAEIKFSDADDPNCSGETADPATDTDPESEDYDPNPKSEEDTPPGDNFDDGTDNTDAGEDEMEDSGTDEQTTDGDCVSLDTGSWSATGECDIFGTDGTAFDELFASGGGSYLYVSSGGSGVASCTLSQTVAVPDGATVARARYNFLSQEWEEWAGSAYNDIFTIYIQGGPSPLVNRTVNNTASAGDWADIDPDSDAATVCEVATSDDAQFNGTGAIFDGQLLPEDEGEVRGEPEDDNVGTSATVPLPEGMTTVTILITVSDVGDTIYDSAGLVESLCFE